MSETLTFVWGFQSADAGNTISSFDVAANAVGGSAGDTITLDLTSFNLATVEEYAISVMGN